MMMSYLIIILMTTLSIPIPQALELFIERMVKRGVGSTKAEVVRQALFRYAEDEAVEAVLRSEQDAREGRILYGNIRDILKKKS